MKNEKDFKKIVETESRILSLTMILITAVLYFYLKFKGLY